jgi:Asp-tRNA(Asn)/Glu-tRNA(Gln) amidotransferase A subunit family amidase
MIRVREARKTDYRQLEADITAVNSREELEQLYGTIVERHERLNALYQFSESFDAEYVIAQLHDRWRLRQADLFAVPFGVKDIFNTEVLPTAMGSEIWRGFKAGNNARVVAEIVERGGVVFSKTTTAEFAVHFIQAGKTVNPFNAGHITGTSSAGSAVSVACGALPIALGTQTAGSIVRPASFCGVYGLKPSFGAYDRTGTLKTTDTLDTIGLLSSDLYGLRKAFVASFQHDPQYPVARRYFDRDGSYTETRPPRVGVIRGQFRGYSEYDPEVKADFDAVLSRLANTGMQVSDVDGIDFINEVHPLHERIYCKSLAYYFQAEAAHGGAVSEVMRQMMERGNAISVAEYVEALRRQPELRERFDRVIDAYDFLITPSTATPAPALGQPERDDSCLIWTFFGYPVLSLPVFWSSAGLPFGLQLIAPKFSDLPLIRHAERVIRAVEGA